MFLVSAKSNFWFCWKSGDGTLCIFLLTGMTFAVMAILGHFSKSLLLFFIPQVFNFIYSLPQLFKVVPCPRHRMPDYDPLTDSLRPSTFTYSTKSAEIRVEDTTMHKSKPSRVARRKHKPLAEASVAAAASSVGSNLTEITTSPTGTSYDNLTLINLVLRILGPMHERTTTNVLLLLQVVCCLFGLLLRYYWSPQVYEATSLQPPSHSASGATLAG